MRVDRIAVGKIKGAHGVKGKVKVAILTDFPSRFKPGLVLQLSPQADDYGELVVETAEVKSREILIKFVGIETRKQAENLRGLTLEVPASEAVPLDEGRYWHFQIIGLGVYTTENVYLGKIEEILTTGANDVYVVRAEESGREILVPAIKDVVKKIDLENEVLIISPMPGLIDEK